MRRFISFPNAVFAVLFALVVYTRFVGLDWGLPYPMHPDERNMTSAILQLRCPPGDFTECMNPHFYAYGQFPLYLAYLLSLVISLLAEDPIMSFDTVTIALRIISATASVIMTWYLYRLVRDVFQVKGFNKYVVLILATFVPAFIQFAHFGTTESLLMMFVMILTYHSFQLLHGTRPIHSYVKSTGVILGLAVGTKVSGALFAIIPFAAILIWLFSERSIMRLGQSFFGLVKIAAIAIVFFIISSPFNIIDWSEFVHSMNYESSVGLGRYKAFYTRSFEHTLPVIFQFFNVFPYALGWPMFVLGFFGFFLLSWKNKYLNLFRIIFLVIFLGNAMMYAKWTRFIAPAFPVLIVFSILVMLRVSGWAGGRVGVFKHLGMGRPVGGWLLFILFGISILPGIAYLSIYRNPDVRFVASQWMYENIPPGTEILSETANVVDVPMPNPLVPIELTYTANLRPISFDFYEVDNNLLLEEDLARHLEEVEYIFVPSRRIYWNHTCFQPMRNEKLEMKNYSMFDGFSSERCSELQKKYPVLNSYYAGLFDGSLGFEPVAEFSSYPRIELFGRTIISFPDEAAEETWTVFDHPVVRVYKRIDL